MMFIVLLAIKVPMSIQMPECANTQFELDSILDAQSVKFLSHKFVNSVLPATVGCKTHGCNDSLISMHMLLPREPIHVKY